MFEASNWLAILIDQRGSKRSSRRQEKAVIRAYEEMPAAFDHKTESTRSHAGIDYRNVYRTGRKEPRTG